LGALHWGKVVAAEKQQQRESKIEERKKEQNAPMNRLSQLTEQAKKPVQKQKRKKSQQKRSRRTFVGEHNKKGGKVKAFANKEEGQEKRKVNFEEKIWEAPPYVRRNTFT